MRKSLFLFVLLTIAWPVSSHAQYAWQNVERIVAVGDVHGAYPQLIALLQGAKLIDANLDWSGGSTHLVSLGDLLDRGAESRKAMDLLMRLQSQAPASGGHVHVLLGNHELMNLSGDLRDVSDAEQAALADLGGHAAAFDQQGHYGRWLLSLPFMIRINGILFTHGGLPPMLSDFSLEKINETAGQDLRAVLEEGKRLREEGVLADDVDLMTATYDASEEMLAALGSRFVNAVDSKLLGGDGPLWYRGTAACHETLENPGLTATLAALGAQRVVVGHTPTPNREINARLTDRVYVIDTGMLAQVYKGNPRLLDITNASLQALDASGQAAPITRLPVADPMTQLASDNYQLQDGAKGMIPLTFADSATGAFEGDGALPAVFEKLSKRDASRAIAAYRLDRELGINMVPASLQRNIGKQQGVVMAWPHRPFSESVRQQSNIGRPNWCAQDSDFSLLAAFDALIGQTGRNADNLFYERGTLNIRITQNFKAFGTTTKLPQTAMQRVLPQAFRAPLESLNAENLTALLGDLLKPREIQALLKRRDAILQWPLSQ